MSANKTIAKNTLFLYFRMLLVMGVSLYTSRIVLRELGISDYGIYSVVGGFVALFGFLNSAMSGATQRYLTFDLGKNDLESLKKTFSTTLTIHFGIAILVLFVAETFGLWYINNKMVYPPERSFAINVVYQFSIVSALLSVIQVPYNALIVARERMNIYAYVSIFEVVFKLLAVFLLVYFGNDKLIMYAVFMFIIALGIRLFYQFYCRKHYKESHYQFQWNKERYKELIQYSSWNLFGNMAVVAKGQGNNMVLNLFFGTTVNAAFGIMQLVNGAISSFIRSFQTASNPQIIKQYAQGEIHSVQKLINQTAKFSYYLSLLLIAPFYINIDFILKLWLKTPPEFSAILTKIALLCLMVDSISGPIMTAVTATGKIKTYHLFIGFLNFLNLPLSYFLLKYRIFNSPEIILYIWLVISIVSLFIRLYFLNKYMAFDVKKFILNVLFPLIFISLICILIGLTIIQMITVSSFITLACQSILYGVLMIFIIFLFGTEASERKVFKSFSNKFFKRK